jgi:hypothetical protein
MCPLCEHAAGSQFPEVKGHLVVWGFGSATPSFMYPEVAGIAYDIGIFSNTLQQIEMRNEPTRFDSFLKQIRADQRWLVFLFSSW